MILNTLLGFSLVIIVSFDTQALPANPAAWMQMSVRQKDAVLMPLVQGATECIVHRFGRSALQGSSCGRTKSTT